MQSHQSFGLHYVANLTAFLAPKAFTTLTDISRHTVPSNSIKRGIYMLIFLDTWYRFIVKKVDPVQSSYSWSEMSFYSAWTTKCTINLCFDVPKASQIRIHQALAVSHKPFETRDVYASHVILLDEILAMFDESVWALRDGVRQIERVLKYTASTESFWYSCLRFTGSKRNISTQDQLYVPSRLCKARYTLNWDSWSCLGHNQQDYWAAGGSRGEHSTPREESTATNAAIFAFPTSNAKKSESALRSQPAETTERD